MGCAALSRVTRALKIFAIVSTIGAALKQRSEKSIGNRMCRIATIMPLRIQVAPGLCQTPLARADPGFDFRLQSKPGFDSFRGPLRRRTSGNLPYPYEMHGIERRDEIVLRHPERRKIASQGSRQILRRIARSAICNGL